MTERGGDADQLPPPARPRAPWGDGPPARADRLLLGAVAFSVLFSLALLPAVPALAAHHPLVLALMRGSNTATVTLGALARVGEGSLIVAILAGIPAIVIIGSLPFWWAGRRWGHNGLHLLLRRIRNPERVLARVERISERFGAAAVLFAFFLPVPNQLVYAFAGLGRMSLGLFVACNAVGAVLWTSVVAALGYALGQRAVDVIEAVGRYSLTASIVIVVALLAAQLVRMRRGRRPQAR